MDLEKSLYYSDDNTKIYLGDSFNLLKEIEPKSINVIFADPPYFLSSGGISCQNGKQVCVDKGKRDESKTIEEKLKYNRERIRLCKNILDDNGTIFVSGTFHNIYSIGVALELEGFSIINNITWVKTNPAPNLGCRCFTNSTETILWARKLLSKNKKGNHFFNYELMKELNGSKQMKDVWYLQAPLKKEKKYGKHPTQKPESLLERIILASTREGDMVLDPFNGSGTTGVVAKRLNRKYIGIEIDEEFADITRKRLEEENNGKKF